MKLEKLGIVGAGSVGATVAYAAMIRGLVRRVVLVDQNTEKAAGEALDLSHGTPFLPRVEVVAGPVAELAECDLVVVTAGAKQKPGESRLDLAERNVGIFRRLVPEIAATAPGARLLIVSNPVDVLTHAAVRLSGLPRERVFGSGTVLDTARFRNLIADTMRIAPVNVHAYIVGEHGDSEVALWSSARVGGVLLHELDVPGHPAISVTRREEMLGAVRQAAGRIIAAKGATNWAIGLACARIIEAVLRDEHAVLTVCRWLVDYHGIRDVCLSVPTVVARHGAGPPLNLRLDEVEIAGLRASAEAVRNVLRRCALA